MTRSFSRKLFAPSRGTGATPPYVPSDDEPALDRTIHREKLWNANIFEISALCGIASFIILVVDKVGRTK